MTQDYATNTQPTQKSAQKDTRRNSFSAVSALKVVHTAVSGRLRFKLTDLQRNNQLKLIIEQQLVQIQPISQVSANVLTGSVLILYDKNVDFEQVLKLVTRNLQNLDQIKPVTEEVQKRTTPPTEGLTERIAKAVINFFQFERSTFVKKTKISTYQTQVHDVWHQVDKSNVLLKLKSSPTSGLTFEEAALRLKRHGPNQLQKMGIRTDAEILLGQFASWPVALLGASAVISIATGGVVDAFVIGAVVLINAGIGFVTEKEGEKTIAALSDGGPRFAAVIREAKLQQIAVEQVIPGDILKLSPGDHIAADARLLKTHRLSVDESSLTGESLPVVKNADSLSQEYTPLADRKNMVYMGSMITGGNGLAVVIGTGKNTELGTIQALAGEAKPPETPMQKQLETMGTQLALISGGICVGVFAMGILRGLGMVPMLKAATSLAVAAVPEGLPAVATTTLALGIRNMKKYNVAIRQIDAVETLGSVQVFCLDKTGTITMNHMTVVEAFVNNRVLKVENAKVMDQYGTIEVSQSTELMELLKVNVLCNETLLEINGNKTDLIGSATENALIEFALNNAIDVTQLRKKFPQVKIHYRSEGRPYIKTEHRLADNKKYIAIKGSPAQLVKMCKWIMLNGKQLPMTEEHRIMLLQENERMAGDALRVLAAVCADSDGIKRNTEDEDLVWLGMVGMQDPVRPGIKELMNTFHQAGIETVMITGDQSATAFAIGKQLNLSNGKPLEILDSSSLEKLDPELLTGLVQKTHVFSRVSPSHKLQIVQAFQRANKVVAMTGDGINDGPALKAANIGVAMGEGGADVARSVSDVVLEDNNLRTMATAVEQGRTIYSNIRKTLHFLLSTNLTEIEVMVAGVILGKGELLNPMQLLWVNLISDIFPGLALSLEPAEKNSMQRQPRDSAEKIIGAKDFKRLGVESATISAATMASYTYGAFRYGPGVNANSIAFMTLSLGQLLHAISCRSDTTSIYEPGNRPRNYYLDVALSGSIAAQILLPFVPFLRKLLGISTFSIVDAAAIGLGATAPLLLNEATKKINYGDSHIIKDDNRPMQTNPNPTKDELDVNVNEK